MTADLSPPDSGRIINISYGSARYASPHIIGYAMTKAAIENFTAALQSTSAVAALPSTRSPPAFSILT
ncbi:hypothetical protein [Antrihabitans spumae]|uniref:SDR family NAD(P)-dependent oxidoreductase n=1 Tax=Antrihabitans spumae TaxID=3373370 RepID=A0ABW7KJN2_9NOCA